MSLNQCRGCSWGTNLANIPCNRSSLFTLRFKRRRLAVFSLREGSSTSPRSSSSSCASINRRKSSNLQTSCSDARIREKDDDEGVDSGFASSSIWTSFTEKHSLSLKSLLGRRFQWGRILFASKRVRSIILLNVITIVYASNIPVVKEVEGIMDPAAFTVVRFVIAAIPFIPFVAQAEGDKDTRNAGIELGFWVSLGYLMQALGLLTSDAGRASFFTMFTVIVVPLLDGMLGAVVPARTWFGAFMSIVGVGMLESSGSPPCVGDLLSFLSAVFFGVHMLRTEQISRSTNKKNFLALLGYQVCVVALLSTLWYFLGWWLEGGLQINRSSWTLKMFWDFVYEFPWIPALYTGIFSTGLCLWVEMVAMRDVSATETAIIYGLEPVWGAGFAWFLLGERWGPTGWLGAILVLGGSLTVQILGSSSSDKSRKDEDKITKANNNHTVSELQSRFSASPAVINSKKNTPNKLTRR